MGVLVSSSTSSHVTSIMRPSLVDITRKYLVKMLNDRDSPYLNQTTWQSPQITATYSSYHFIETPTTILQLNTWFKERYTSWDCTGGNHPLNCTGFYISEVKYEGTIYNDQLYDRYTGGPITDIYQVDAWYMDPALNTYERLDFGNETLFEVNFPLNDRTTLVGDDIQVGFIFITNYNINVIPHRLFKALYLADIYLSARPPVLVIVNQAVSPIGYPVYV